MLIAGPAIVMVAVAGFMTAGCLPSTGIMSGTPMLDLRVWNYL